jgi:hypothetical protein
MTWSTLPSQSQRDTGPVTRTSPVRDERDPTSIAHQIPGAFDTVMFEETADDVALPHDVELEEIILASPRGNTEVSLSSICYGRSYIVFQSPRYREVRARCRWLHLSHPNHKLASLDKRPSF